MDCKSAKVLLMKYMDGDISKKEVLKLRSHTDCCEKCREEFLIYTQILEGFDELEKYEAPEGFEACVMEKIQDIEVEYSPDFAGVFGCGLLCAFSVLFGIAGWMLLNREALISYLYSVNGLEEYVAYFEYIFRYVDNISANVVAIGAGTRALIAGYMPQIQGFVLLLIIGIAMVATLKKNIRVEY